MVSLNKWSVSALKHCGFVRDAAYTRQFHLGSVSCSPIGSMMLILG